MFVYISNTASEDLKNDAGQATVPIAWMWNGVYNVSYGWTAAAYLSNFFVYGLVSGAELVAWIMYMVGYNEFLGWWAPSYGWYGSVYLGLLPILFASFQLGFSGVTGGLDGNESVEFGRNAVFLLAMGVIMWIQAASVHIIYGLRLQCHIEANPRIIEKKDYKCPLKQQKAQSKEDFDKACKAIEKATEE